MLILPLIMSNIVLLLITNRLVKTKLFSPLYLQYYFSLLTVVAAIIYYYFVEDKMDLFELDNISEKVFLRPLEYYLVSFNALFLGFLGYCVILDNKSQFLFQSGLDINRLKKVLQSLPSNIGIPVTLLIGDICSLFFTYGNGIWERADYIPALDKIAFLTLTFVGFMFVLFNSLAYRQNPKTCTLLMWLFLFLNITTGSRKIIVYYLLYIFISYVIGPKQAKNKVRLVISIIISILLLSYVMELRALSSHGFIPYLSSSAIIFSGMADDIFFSLYYVTIFGYFVTANVMDVYSYSFSWSDIITSINPLPGEIAGWDAIMESMRFNIVAPYNSFGEVFTAGFAFSGIFYCMLGCYYGFIEKTIRKLYISGKVVFALVLFTLTIYSIVLTSQYNLRLSLRPIYYSIIIIMIRWLYNSLFKKDSINVAY
jgi:hypothetical protein